MSEEHDGYTLPLQHAHDDTVWPDERSIAALKTTAQSNMHICEA